MNGHEVVIKILKDELVNEHKYTMTKIALVLKDINSENIVKFLGLSKQPVGLLLEFCEITYKVDDDVLKFNNLRQLLSFLNDHEVFDFNANVQCGLADFGAHISDIKSSMSTLMSTTPSQKILKLV